MIMWGGKQFTQKKITRSNFNYLRNKNQNIEACIDPQDPNYLWIRPEDDEEVPLDV